MKTMPLNIVYPVWAGMGTVFVVGAGLIFFHETTRLTKKQFEACEECVLKAP